MRSLLVVGNFLHVRQNVTRPRAATGTIERAEPNWGLSSFTPDDGNHGCRLWGGGESGACAPPWIFGHKEEIYKMLSTPGGDAVA
jgi:hypothetical protein